MLVFGAGAIGAYLGGKLARRGHEVTLVGRRPVIGAISRDGLRVDAAQGDAYRATHVRAAENADALAMMRYDVCLVCTKAYAVDEAIHALRGTAQRLPDLPFVTFQNGLGSEEAFAAAIGAGRIIAGTTTTPVSILGPGHIRVEKAGGEGLALVARGDADGPAFSTVTARALLRAALDAHEYADFREMKWSKLLLNLIGNATSAILDVSVAEIYADSRGSNLELAMLREALAVMRAMGLRPHNLPRGPAATLASAVRFVPAALLRPALARMVARGRGDKRPSLHADVVNRAGRSEAPWLNGAVAERGRAVGVPTPVNARLTATLMRLVRGEDDPAAWRGRLDRLADVEAPQA